MNRGTRLVWGLLAGAVLSMAQTKVYVATFGNDANPCNTFSQPCATWIGAVTKAGVNGVVLALDSGDFGRLIISQPVVIDGGMHGAFVTSSDNAVQVSVTSSSAFGPVVLRNLSIVLTPSFSSGIGQYGISGTLAQGSLVLDHVNISATPELIDVISSDGMLLTVGAGVSVGMKDVSVEGVWGGISLFGAGPTLFNASFDNVTVGARDQAMNILEGSITMRNSSLRNTFNAQFCLNLYGSVTSPVSLIEGTEIANCTTGIRMNQGTLRLSNNVITGNGTGLSLTSAAATAITFRNNVFAGNGVDGAPSLAASLK